VAIERGRVRDGDLKLSDMQTMFDQFSTLRPLEKHMPGAHGTIDELVSQCRSALERGDLLL